MSGSESFASSADPEETLPGPRFPHLVIPSVVGELKSFFRPIYSDFKYPIKSGSEVAKVTIPENFKISKLKKLPF